MISRSPKETCWIQYSRRMSRGRNIQGVVHLQNQNYYCVTLLLSIVIHIYRDIFHLYKAANLTTYSCDCWKLCWIYRFIILAWWHHQMESFSMFLSICVGNSPVTGEFPAHRPVTWSLDAFFDLCLNKRLSKQSWGWWCEMPLCTTWRHCNLSHEYHYDVRCGHCDGVLINCFCFLGDLHNKIMVINNLMLELYSTLIKEWNLTYSF